MATPTFYCTRRMTSSGSGRVLRVYKQWGFEVGDIVKFTAYPITRPKDSVTLYKKVCASGTNSQVIYVDRNWGFGDDELIVYSLTPVEDMMIV